MSQRILIIEDDRRIATALKSRLAARGYEITVAHDAADAANTALELRPGLILLDLCIPGGSGFGVIEELTDELEPNMPRIVVVTASGRPGLRQAALDYGADAFFLKPYDPAKLLRRIEELLPIAPDPQQQRTDQGLSMQEGGY